MNIKKEDWGDDKSPYLKQFMKALSIFLLVLQVSSCFTFQESKTPILNYRLDSTIRLEIYSVGYGATTGDVTEILKNGPSGTSVENE